MCSFGTEKQHVGESRGGEAFLFNHYVTSNEHAYGSYWNGFKSSVKPLDGAGYVTNIRPAVYFSPKFDAIDNPGMM